MKRTAKPSSRWSSWICCEDLALDDDVERGRRLVHDHQLGLERERHRDDHALAHAAGELVRVGANAAAVDADQVEQVGGPRRARARFEIRSCACIMSTNWSPTRITGLSAFIALWKTIETLRQRNLRSSSALWPTRSSPRKRTLPPTMCAGGRRICIDRVRDRALAAARLAGEADDLAGADRQVDAVDGAHAALVPAVLDAGARAARAASPARARRGRALGARDDRGQDASLRPCERAAADEQAATRSSPRRGFCSVRSRGFDDLVDAGEHEHEPEHGERERDRAGRRTATTRPGARSS